MNALAAFIVIAGCLFLRHSGQDPLAPGKQSSLDLEKRALADTQRIPAQDLDPELPKLPFGDWFKQVVGPGAGVTWQLSECGEIKGAAADSGGDIRACAEANTILADGRRVIVMITVGTFKKGMTGAPAFHIGVIEHSEGLYQVRRLRDLPKLLSTPLSLANRPAVNLPELNIPVVGPAVNNNLVNLAVSLNESEPGQSIMIEEAAPPPPPSPQPKAASSAETGSAPSGVDQGAPIVKPQPKYPQNARRFNASGRVEVRVTISVAGQVTRANAISGHPLLRDAAVEAARKWEFKPTMVDGVPVETELVLAFDFTAPPPPP